MGELRFIPKKHGEGRGAHWRVYDRLRGSYPIQRPDLPGLKLTQNYSEKEAAEVAQQLTELAGYMPAGGRPKTAIVSRAPAPQPDVEDETDDDAEADPGDEDAEESSPEDDAN